MIRVYPSPGNFEDWRSPGQNHNLIYEPDGATPGGASYCGDPQGNDGLPSAPYYFRSPGDVAAEMNAIYNLNVANGWPADRFFFEPANEPNKEWYADKYRDNPNLFPHIDNEAAWMAMDNYFMAIYDTAKTLNNGIQILTPPMSQNAYAEYRQFGSCVENILIVDGVPTSGVAGYDKMPRTYDDKNNGWSWHNYWRNGVEFWQDAYCSSDNILSDQLFQAFPQALQDRINISVKPAFITEADLLSPCVYQDPLHIQITNKDVRADAAQESIWRFAYELHGADYVAVWMLTSQWADPPLPNSGQDVGNCDDPSGNPEQAWHEAYRDAPYNGTYERDWFWLWWLRDEFRP